jgi:hypothetical protein
MEVPKHVKCLYHHVSFHLFKHLFPWQSASFHLFRKLFPWLSVSVQLFTCLPQCSKYFSQSAYHRATSRKVAGSIADVVTGIFHEHNPSCRTVALGLTQPLTETSKGIFPGGKDGRYVRPTTLPPSCAVCLEISSSWNLQGLSMPVQGLLYLYLVITYRNLYVLIIIPLIFWSKSAHAETGRGKIVV